ncbi:transcription factor E2F3 [Eucyclogobius newberryi]|uniref:transcription factor E2F3 n=1 Tax=Eucyclogobius newberryi TaxID=166745 RepID=UPI003B5BDDD4
MAVNILQAQALKPERVNFICVVPGCTNNDVNTRNVRFHSFPVTQVAQRWLDALGTEAAPPSSSMGTVCSKHFRKEDYLEDQSFVGTLKDCITHQNLKPEAVPSIFVRPSLPLDKTNTLGFVGALKDCITHRNLKPEAVPSMFFRTCLPLDKTNTLGQRKTKTTEEENEEEDDEEDEEDDDETDLTSPEAVTRNTHVKRADSAIGRFTTLFMKTILSSPNGLLDLNDFAKKIKMSKRRVYDITNVLQGIRLIRKTSKNVVEWVGWPSEFMDKGMKSLAAEEFKLDASIRNVKQLIEEMHQRLQNNRYPFAWRKEVSITLAYLTYEDIQNLSMFEDQAVLMIKAPPETKLEVAHPKEAFQIHITSTKGPVEVLVCSDDVSPIQRQRKFADGDYSNVPLRGSSTAAVSGKENANHDNSKSKTTSSSSSEPSPHLSLPLVSSPKSTPVPPSLEEQLNSSPPSPPVAICIKEEMTNLNITPDEPMNAPEHEPDQLTTDVHMTDVS